MQGRRGGDGKRGAAERGVRETGEERGETEECHSARGGERKRRRGGEKAQERRNTEEEKGATHAEQGEGGAEEGEGEQGRDEVEGQDTGRGGKQGEEMEEAEVILSRGKSEAGEKEEEEEEKGEEAEEKEEEAGEKEEEEEEELVVLDLSECFHTLPHNCSYLLKVWALYRSNTFCHSGSCTATIL